jgi:hypothetical protein
VPGPLFPVVVRDETYAPPCGAETFYVLAANGLFLERHTPLFSASVPAPAGVPGLTEHATGLVLRLPRIPSVLVERAVGFFRAVWARWEAEGILLAFYAPTLRRFALTAPPQRVTGRVERGRFRADLRLDYLPCAPPGPEFLCVGSLHSHGAFGARHSAVDAHDERFEAGLHVTVGHVTRTRPEFEASFVVGGCRFPLAPEAVLGRFARARPPLERWFDEIVLCRATAPTAAGVCGAADGPATWWAGPR